MKNRNIFFVILIITMFCITGCITPVPYSFAENESENGTAEVKFITKGEKQGVDLFYFEDTELPIPKRNVFWGTGNYWSPVIFPAGRPFNLKVNVYYRQFDKGSVKVFNCPALTAGGSYTLEFVTKKGATFLFIPLSEGTEKLVLKDKKTKAVVYEQ